jgi:exopolysaccharide biosynthesis polyprenyl glycosylphosphotransferase
MKKYRLSFLIKPIAYLLDIGVINLSFITAYYIKFGHLNDILETPYVLLFWVINASWIAILAIFKPFNDSRISFNIPTLLFNYTKIIFLLLAVVSLFWVSFKGYYYSRAILFNTILIAGFLGVAWRVLGVYFFRAYRQLGYNNRSFAVVGGGDLAKHITQYFVTQPELGYACKGVFNETANEVEDQLSYLDQLCLQNEIDTVYLCTPYLKVETISKYIALAEQFPIQIKLITDFRGFLQKGVSVEYHGYIPVINVAKNPYADPKVELTKRTFDICFAVVFITLSSPLLLLLGAITKLTSSGSIFYKSERVGKWGNKFEMWKFRSMYTNADEIARLKLNGKMHSIGSQDPRVTKWGHFMRKTRLDEFPQFFNVLVGDMSVVGPRPLAQYDVDMLMDGSPKNFRRLLAVRPGVTSLGQLKFGYAINQKENLQRMTYDLLYLKKFSFSTDMWLIYLTAKVMIQGKGK